MKFKNESKQLEESTLKNKTIEIIQETAKLKPEYQINVLASAMEICYLNKLIDLETLATYYLKIKEVYNNETNDEHKQN